MLINDLVSLFQGDTQLTDDQFRERSHELFYLHVQWILLQAIVTACDHTEQFAVWRTILGDTDRGVLSFFNQIQDIRQCVLRSQVGVTDNESSLEFLDLAYHFRLAFDRL